MEINTSQILKGTLEACILQLIKNKDMYGYEITEQLSNYGLDMVAQGTIYPLLMKLEKENLVVSYLKESNFGPPRKYYSITEEGNKYIVNFNIVRNKYDKILSLAPCSAFFKLSKIELCIISPPVSLF